MAGPWSLWANFSKKVHEALLWVRLLSEIVPFEAHIKLLIWDSRWIYRDMTCVMGKTLVALLVSRFPSSSPLPGRTEGKTNYCPESLGTSHALGEEPILSAGHWKMVWNFRFQMWRCWKTLDVWQMIRDMYVCYIICALAISRKGRIVRWMHEICMTWWNGNEWYWMALMHIDARHEVEATRASWIIESGDARPWRRHWTSWMWRSPSWQAGDSRWFLRLITLRESCQRERPTGVRWCN